MGFIPANFWHATPFHNQLRVRHGTDKQTDNDHQCMPPPYGGGGILSLMALLCTAQKMWQLKQVEESSS